MAEEISKILIVDDQPDNIDTIKDILGDGEYSLFSATNGKEALEIFKKVNPDLVLLDALMPVMDGFQVAREIKNNPETQLTPVIMITALDSMQDRVKVWKPESMTSSPGLLIFLNLRRASKICCE